MTIQQQIINNLPQAKYLFFPNACINKQNTGNQYLEVKTVELYTGEYSLWACAQTTAGEVVISCDTSEKTAKMVEYFLQTNQNKTVLMYIGLDDVDVTHTDFMRLVQYGEYRSVRDKNLRNAIDYVMINGVDYTIPF